VPNEHQTQQSPALGRNTTLQAGQSKKNWHASVGMTPSVTAPHSGQVNSDTKDIEDAIATPQ